MKSLYIRIGLSVVVVLLSYDASLGQCGYTASSGTSYPTIPCNSFSSNILVGSGTYTYFTAVAGRNYTISTCGSSFDTQLTIYDANPAWTWRAYNDNNGPDCASTNASVNWTATYSGDHLAVVNRNNCQQHDFQGVSAILKFRVCGSATAAASSTWNAAGSNTNWHDNCNWTSCVPGTNTNATINNTSYQPVVNSAAFVNTITVNAPATVTVNSTLTATQ